jgi:hypothetical protein
VTPHNLPLQDCHVHLILNVLIQILSVLIQIPDRAVLATHPMRNPSRASCVGGVLWHNSYCLFANQSLND